MARTCWRRSRDCVPPYSCIEDSRSGDAPPEADPLNFAPRVTVPVLMLNGDQDFIFEAELSQKPLFRFLGSPADRKKYLVYPGITGVFLEKRSQVIRETLDCHGIATGPGSITARRPECLSRKKIRLDSLLRSVASWNRASGHVP